MDFRGIYPIHKERSETLAMLLERFRVIHGLDASIKLTYAGRLDPMAEGIVLVLAGESRFEKDELLGVRKTYEVDVLLGVGTDTHDVLGLITQSANSDIGVDTIANAVSTMTAITSLPYPMYSSVLVAGKPLFVHARAGTSVDIPEKKVTIYSAEILDMQKVSVDTLVTTIASDIQKVVGDFRQEVCIEKWEEYRRDHTGKEVQIVTIRIEASSGTYMRTLATWLGERLDVPALAYRIVRTMIGEYGVNK